MEQRYLENVFVHVLHVCLYQNFVFVIKIIPTFSKSLVLVVIDQLINRFTLLLVIVRNVLCFRRFSIVSVLVWFMK